MEKTLWIVILPALVALCFKAGIFIYARGARGAVRHNLQTQLYLLALFALSIQNVAEIKHFHAILSRGVLPTFEVTIFYAASIAALSLFFHLSLTFANGLLGAATVRRFYGLGYILCVSLEILLIFTPWLIKGYETMGHTVTRVPGPLYFLFEVYVLLLSAGIVAVLVYGATKESNASRRARATTVLFAVVPMLLVAVFVVAALHIGMRRFNAALAMPIATTYFLVVTAYAVHQYRLFDIQFYIPWSKVRKRKTVFYDRIRAMISEIADLVSVKQAMERLADTLHCPVALVGGPTPVLAASGTARLTALPMDQLRTIDRIVVANEIADSMPDLHASMTRHNVAAVVPFYPHSQNASSWLLLGDAFSDQVYTPLDFRMVEQLFDRMADLFLDKLLTMRAQLAQAHQQIQTLEFRLQNAESNATCLQQKIETLSRENLRLVREQPADSLAAPAQPSRRETTVTFLGRDKQLLKQLREHFPQMEQFAGPDSSSFQRKPAPAVALCHIDQHGSDTWQKQLDIVTEKLRDTALLFFGDAAKDFAFANRRRLIDTLVEVLPADTTIEALVRKLEALARLRESRVSTLTPEYPLIGAGPAYRETMTEVTRIAGFVDSVCIVSDDANEANAIGRHMHDIGRNTGAFRVLQTARLLAREGNALEELHADLKECVNGTIMVDDIAGLTNEVWERLLLETNDFAQVRLIARCSTTAAKSPNALFNPLSPLVLRLPTLRERRDDLPLLVHYYTLQFNLQAGEQRYMSKADLDDLMDQNYPKDLASLKAAVFECLTRQRQPTSQAPASIASLPTSEHGSDKTLEEHVADVEKRLIADTLARCDGNKSKTARMLGLKPNTLHYKLERYGLVKRDNS